MVALARPIWPHCGYGADRTDPIGCRGVRVSDYTACLAHLTDDERGAYRDGLAPGADVDHRGTTFTADLLGILFDALLDHDTAEVHLGAVRFDEARFLSDAIFEDATFSGYTADFSGAIFSGDAQFDGTIFSGEARFDRAAFSHSAFFREARFSDRARFEEATFSGEARFDRAAFSRDARFQGVTFADETGFDGATFSDWAQFDGATFAVSSRFGPLVCAQRVGLSGALFEAPVTLEIAAQEVACQRTQWRSTATMRLRYATVDLDDAVLAFPVAVTAHPAPFTTIFGKVPEQLLEGLDSTTMVTSVRGVDAAHLVLTDIDLSACRFFGAFHLDQIRLVGCTFARTPTGAHHLWPFEWTSRRTLVEEHHWRARTPDRKGFNPNLGWRIPPTGTEPSLIPEPEVVSGLYQQLRKALEDAKNEPDAADFYYGEMEMRRHDRENRPRSERILLTAYWMISGYGLRALRAFGSLFFAMVLTMVLLMWVGLPADPPAPRTRGTVTAEQKVDVTTKVPGPGGAAPGPLGERFTRERAEKAGRTAVNSVVFRSAGQGLTVAGTYIEMASRLVEPVLLALALLAIRGRVKR